MLVCEGCDKGFHIYCIEPKLSEIPKGSFRICICLFMCVCVCFCCVSSCFSESLIFQNKQTHTHTHTHTYTHTHTPGIWKCVNCTVCMDCGKRDGVGRPGRWNDEMNLCSSCARLRSTGHCCPVCNKSYRATVSVCDVYMERGTKKKKKKFFKKMNKNRERLRIGEFASERHV